MKSRIRAIQAPLKLFLRPRYEARCITGGVEFLVGYADGWYAWGMHEECSDGIFIWCLSDNRLALRSYRSSNWGGMHHKQRVASIRGEICRILSMSAEDLNDFLSSRDGYNPFADRRNREIVARKDMKIRLEYRASSFVDSRLMTSAAKRGMVHEFERYIAARVFGGVGHAVSRFSQRLGENLMIVFPSIREKYENENLGRLERNQLESFLVDLSETTPAKDLKDVGDIIKHISREYNKVKSR